LVENLSNLRLLRNAGKLGKLFDEVDVKVPAGLSHFRLVEFDQVNFFLKWAGFDLTTHSSNLPGGPLPRPED
jgi:hypothetical protein